METATRSQVPDVFIELIDSSRMARTHLLRCDVRTIRFMPGRQGNAIDARWRSLSRDPCYTDAECSEALCDPQLLLCIWLQSQPAERVCREIKPSHRRIQEHANRRSQTVHEQQSQVLQDAAEGGSDGGGACDNAHSEGSREQIATLKPLVESLNLDCRRNLVRYCLRVHVYRARLHMVCTKEGTEPLSQLGLWVGVESPDLTCIQSETTRRELANGPSPEWSETLELFFKQIDSNHLSLASPVKVCVHDLGTQDQQDGCMLGKLELPLHSLLGARPAPKWMPLRMPGATNEVGELLLGLELFAEKQVEPLTRGSFAGQLPDTQSCDILVNVVGARDLKDPTASFFSAVKHSRIEYRLGEYKTKTTVGHGSDPMWCSTSIWRGVKLPRQTLHAPSLVFSVAEASDSESDSDSEASGPGSEPEAKSETTSAEGQSKEQSKRKRKQKVKCICRPTSHPTESAVQSDVQSNAQSAYTAKLLKPIGAVSVKLRYQTQNALLPEADANHQPILGRYRRQKWVTYESAPAAHRLVTADIDRRKRKQRLLAAKREAEISDRIGQQLPAPRSAGNSEGVGRSSRWKAAILATVSTNNKTQNNVTALTPSKIVRCCESDEYAQSISDEFGYTFKFAVAPAGRKGKDPAYLVGRCKVLDELECGYPQLSAIDILPVRSYITGEPCGNLMTQVLVAQSDPAINDDNDAEQRVLSLNNSLKIVPTEEEVIVRLYAVRAFRLRAHDSGNSSDPYVLATLGEEQGRWPQGSVCQGKRVGGQPVEKDPQMNNLAPYFGKVFEWHGVRLPSTDVLRCTVWDYDKAGSDDCIGTTEIDLTSRFYSRQWQALGSNANGE